MTLEARMTKRLASDFLLEVELRADGGCVGILGASGSGKSMALKCIAGIETPDEGRIAVNGRTLYDSAAKINLRPQERRIGYLFQNYALFPKMSVEQNIGLGVPGTAAERKQVVAEYIFRFQLDGLEERLPGKLSGGQQQRTALARMLAAAPEAVLLDEPFSALDFHLREQMQNSLLDIFQNQRDAIMVTHSRDEAYKLCSELIVLDNGKVLGGGPTRALFQNPVSLRVAQLTGCKNYSRVEKRGPASLYAVDWGLLLNVAAPIPGWAEYIGVRAHDLTPVTGSMESDNVVNVQVVKRVEEPFEWCVVFTNRDARPAERGQIWWKYSKYLFTEPPSRLRIPPEAVFFLKNDVDSPDA